MIDTDWNPDARKLRHFAWICPIGFPILAFIATKLATAFGQSLPAQLSLYAVGIGLAVGLLGTILPRAVLPIYLGLVILTLPIGLAVGFLALPLIYYGLFTPVAILLKLLGKDPMDRKPHERQTCWVKRKPAPPAANYYKQF